MKIIEIDEDLYQYIATQAQAAEESTSDILRRLLLSSSAQTVQVLPLQSEAVTKPFMNDETSQSAVENSSVLTEQSEREKVTLEDGQNVQTDFTSSPTVDISVQPEEVVQQLVNEIRRLLNSADFQQESTAVSRFLALLTVLYRNNPDNFAQATLQEAFQGRSRTYFAQDEATLLAAGNHTKPKQIPDTPYWVITNTNSARKMLMLERTMQFMQLPENLINEVRSYFSAD